MENSCLFVLTERTKENLQVVETSPICLTCVGHCLQRWEGIYIYLDRIWLHQTNII